MNKKLLLIPFILTLIILSGCNTNTNNSADKSFADSFKEIMSSDVLKLFTVDIAQELRKEMPENFTEGMSEEEAAGMIVGGFIEPIVKELPLEYAVELNRLIELQMEGSVG